MTSLFDPIDANPIVHRDDPVTSHEAADRVNQSGRRSAHKELVLSLVKRSPGSTAVELFESATDAEKAKLVEMQEVRRRLTDLLSDNRVKQGGARVCRVRGTRMVTWEVK